MSNIIDSIQLSGTVYTLSAQTSGGNNVVELTQAQYDALVDKDPDAFYIITDAQAGDLTNYYTKAETSGATELATAFAATQPKLSAGTNITIDANNVISAEGGGKAIEAGRGITITTGETADTVSFNLPISAGTGTNSVIEGYANNKASGDYSHAEGLSTSATSIYSHAEGYQTLASGQYAHAEGLSTTAQTYCHSEGYQTNANSYYSHTEGYQTVANGSASHVEGGNTSTSNSYEHASGRYNVSNKANTTFGNSGNTLFSVGNGTSSARHNAFEIRQNGDIYLTLDGQDVKLQDQLGGGSSYTAGDGIDITNDVISVTGKTDSSAFTAHTADTTVHTTAAEKTSWNGAATNASNAVTALGGLSLIKLTQAEYDALATKDNSTLYVIVN